MPMPGDIQSQGTICTSSQSGMQAGRLLSCQRTPPHHRRREVAKARAARTQAVNPVLPKNAGLVHVCSKSWHAIRYRWGEEKAIFYNPPNEKK